MSTVKVAVRVRPINKREMEMNSSVIIHMEANATQISNIKLPSTGDDTFGRERVKQFTYDYSYWSADESRCDYASQEKVFDDLGFDIVQSSYQGYNACIFAYGQTGSGKTYTMMGSPEDPGLTPRVCESLFSYMCVGDTTYRTEVSYLEIYNERVRDLLRDHNQSQLNLKVREHPKDGPYVQDLSRHLVMSYSDIKELLNRGNGNRTTAATNMNDQSSRSHAIFTILFTQAKFTEDIPSEVHSKIHLVDLAGSERADMAGTTGERLKEGGSINKSLVTLGNVISSLADLSEKPSGSASRRSVFIPYRDSVLTWLLKDSLGGNSKTIMIATISPADCHYAETLSTLRYAKRAKKIVNKPTINEDPNVKLIRELRAENARLRALLADSKRHGDLTPMKDFAETREKLTRNEEKVQALLESWAVKWQEAASILREHEMLALRKEGCGVVLDSELPYLLCVDDNILSTGMKLYHLKEGDTSVGREDAAKLPDIVLVGRCIEADHCTIHYEGGVVTLFPLGGAMCFVDNVRISEPTKLSQGSVIRLGRSHLFRFNHPGEVARMREELKESGKKCSLRVWKDIQWMSSTISMTDSAVGSDLGEWLEYDRLEEKRREVERLEEEHCLAEARRLSLLASQEANREELKQKEEELHRLSTNAQVKIESLNASIQHQYYITQLEKGRLLEEQKRLQDLQSKFEQEKALDLAEKQKVQCRIDLEQARLDVEHSRQLAEWAEMTTERQHQMSLRENERQDLSHQKDQIEKFHNIEKKIWKEEIAEMRNLVDSEIQNMRVLARLSSNKQDEGDDDSSSDMKSSRDEDADSLILDIDSLKLIIPPDEEGAIIPELYLTQSSEALEDASASMNRNVVEKEIPEDLSSVIDQLIAQSYDLHERVCVNLQFKYSSFHTTPRKVELDGEFNTQLRNICQVVEQVESEKLILYQSSEGSTVDQASINERLEECKRLTIIVEKLLWIDATITRMENMSSEQEYQDVLDGLESVHSLLTSMEAEEEVEVKVQRVIQTELCIIRERLLYAISEAWNHLVKWILPSEIRRLARKPQTVTLEFSRDGSSRSLFSVVVTALVRGNMLDSRVKTLCENLMSYVIENVVRDRSTVLQVTDEPDRCIICVVINPAAVGQPRQVVLPSEAFLKLEQIFSCLHGALSEVAFSPAGKMVAEGVCDAFLVKKIGKLITRKLFDYVYDECISLALPANGTQWEKYNELVAQAEHFQEFLARLGFLSIGDPSLIDYLNNVNSLFANNKSQEILKKAHELMLQELFHSVQISSDHPIGFPKSAEFLRMEEFVKYCRMETGTTAYKLPKCQISLSICNIMLLTYETLKEAQGGSQEGAFHLCNSIHNLFELYCDVVPSYHKDKIASHPLPAALFLNNCSFVAHHLLTIDKAFCLKLTAPGTSLPPPGREPKLAELIPKVRRLGNDGFAKHIQNKKDEICQCLSEAEGFSCVADNEGSDAMTVVQNMLHHLKHIGSTWSDILPTTIYCRSIGTLLSVALEEMIENVSVIEEFSVDDCLCLQRIFSYLIQSATDIFRTDDSVSTNPEVTLHEFVCNWMKFKELTLVLGFCLQEVSDRWSDGKGPLALHFTGKQVAGLVTAMFEKTARRDALVTHLYRKPSIHMPDDAT